MKRKKKSKPKLCNFNLKQKIIIILLKWAHERGIFSVYIRDSILIKREQTRKGKAEIKSCSSVFTFVLNVL